MIISGVAIHHKWFRGTHGDNQIRTYAKSAVFFFTSPYMSVKLKLLLVFGFNQMILKMFLISVG